MQYNLRDKGITYILFMQPPKWGFVCVLTIIFDRSRLKTDNFSQLLCLFLCKMCYLCARNVSKRKKTLYTT